MPDNKTRNYVKTRSSEKGTAENFNELRFEDKKDSEEVYFHAEKDFNRVVENNDTLKVGFDKKDKGDQTIEIYNDRTASLAEGNESLTVKKGTRTVTVQKDDTHEVKDGSRIVTVQKDDTHTVKQGDLSVTVDMGNASYKISQGKCTIEAMQSIELKVGATSIKLTPTGVTIQSTMIKLASRRNAAEYGRDDQSRRRRHARYEGRDCEDQLGETKKQERRTKKWLSLTSSFFVLNSSFKLWL